LNALEQDLNFGHWLLLSPLLRENQIGMNKTVLVIALVFLQITLLAQQERNRSLPPVRSQWSPENGISTGSL